MTERVFKILVIGDSTVGKTSFVQRYVNNSFTKDYKCTIGVDFSLKVIQRSENDTIRLQLWDIAGQERFTSMTRVYYREAVGCVILFDITAPKTFYKVVDWKNDLDSKVTLPSGKSLPCLLLANKCDLPAPAVSGDDIERVSKERGFLRWSEISVKDDIGVTESMNYLADAILADSENTARPSSDSNRGAFIHLRNQPGKKDQDEGSCCLFS